MNLNKKRLFGRGRAYWLIFSRDEILTPEQEPRPMQAEWEELEFVHAYHERVLPIGEYRDLPCYAIDLQHEAVEQADISLHNLRTVFAQGDEHLFQLVARAWQLVLFQRTHRFCGQCGARMRQVDWEMATVCDTCKHRCYPRISPCIIVAIRRDDRILLAQGPNQQKKGIYSTLAGFVESGESLEQAVHREVMEEVGINICNLEYFGSQPWPFPHSLMMGYLAEYGGGEIKVDGHEILRADWFSPDQLPHVPPTLSISGQLIEATLARINSDQ